ncbi:CRP/FNR family transcriptional regulator, anaerobic regulatory protein [Bathymodiolus platifrons methanotrophic gill symbiont]|uniref:Crp/Fnr family transcriptional regulator n=1 Tax=Bathymodiolus platifrons methanotrophic gill symbiont TaxID=113268 RepID=UPI000B40EF4A|nr:Crp/Fnr family transcriptional regulator [Bathymodiolus platifrons methanotrophic gill symbiont]TXL13811.1 Crp/Fnr family transcriptional regulator [Methylococcaceae bacterium HT4]TXL18493.1 Crp/Fnr family transcriptional regulator [Methylococcaceae bacterium HT3]TXL19330.1 Crp/Fnr family transcriptional regulator [Methylococcaceae bacterium HT5]TXL22978.1 Crp/Fnr family transcriptional regulator [Methylococcaceae bacterium HT2]GAW85235.1 CRP/FNR family transcriptional regulator, anaerobic 
MESISAQQLWETNFPEFIKAGEAGLNSLMASAKLVELPAGQQVFYPGAACEQYLLVLKGSVKAQIISEGGREMLLYRVCSGESCVLTTSCLLSGDKYPAEGITEGEVMAFAISSHAFYRCMERSAFFREFVFKKFSARLSGVIALLEDVTFNAIDTRLAKALLAEESDVILLTHQELATTLGSAREVISRHLKRFEAYGWVSLNRGTVNILNANALLNVATKQN